MVSCDEPLNSPLILLLIKKKGCAGSKLLTDLHFNLISPFLFPFPGWNLPCNKAQKLSSNSLTELQSTEFPFQAAGAERKQGPSEGAVPGM